MTRSLFALFASVALVVGCASKAPAGGADPRTEKTTLRVENRGFLDMTIYVVNGGQRVRLGIANGNRSTDLVIPAYLVNGGLLSFIADPIGGSRTPVSDEIQVSPGDAVELLIPSS